MISDLLEAAELACRSFWDGSDKSKINLREAMTDLRVCVNAELKKRAQESTQRLTKDHNNA
jgi:hypothetical protein